MKLFVELLINNWQAVTFSGIMVALTVSIIRDCIRTAFKYLWKVIKIVFRKRSTPVAPSPNETLVQAIYPAPYTNVIIIITFV